MQCCGTLVNSLMLLVNIFLSAVCNKLTINDIYSFTPIKVALFWIDVVAGSRTGHVSAWRAELVTVEQWTEEDQPGTSAEWRVRPVSSDQPSQDLACCSCVSKDFNSQLCKPTSGSCEMALSSVDFSKQT